MATLLLKHCPQCSQPFQASRKNQFYCSAQCRIDANNETAKARYATFKEDAPKIDSVQNELRKLKSYVASLVVIIQGVEEIDRDTISYEGRVYKRQGKIDRLNMGVSLQPGGAIKVGLNKINYRKRSAISPDSCWEYVTGK